MGTKIRALGADVTLKGITEVNYGVAPADGYVALAFKTSDLDSEKPLGEDSLLGGGSRDSQDPFYNPISVKGNVAIPLDVQGAGFWLKGVLGAPATSTVKAKGSIAFSALPAAASTITLNGTAWTFVAAAAAGNQTQIQGTVIQTIDQLVADLNAAADAEVVKCTFSRAAGTQVLSIERDAAGVVGNVFAIAADAAANGAASNGTLLGGGYSHVFTSGGELPSQVLEVGHPQLIAPKFLQFLGCSFGGINFDMSRSGPANAVVDIIAQARVKASATIDATPSAYILTRFSQGGGSIRKDGVQLAGVTAGRFTFSNTLEAIETIRADGLIDGVDPGESKANGSITLRYGADSTMEDAADNETPLALEYGFMTPQKWALTFSLPRVFLPKAKNPISGPGGIQAATDWQAARDAAAGHLLQVTLINDVAGY